jgi:hypothetical protein
MFQFNYVNERILKYDQLYTIKDCISKRSIYQVGAEIPGSFENLE